MYLFLLLSKMSKIFDLLPIRQLVMVLILRKTSCIEIYWRRLSGLGSDYWQSSACSYCKFKYFYISSKYSHLRYLSQIFYLADSPCSVGIGMILGGVLFISLNQKIFFDIHSYYRSSKVFFS